MAKPKRVLSGMRPTGRLHLGHYFGALSNWLKLQEEYECFFFVADWHALTTHYEDTSSIAENTLQVAIDWLAVGLDPAKSTLFIQSSILEHAELHVLLSMITPLSWLERVPTYKEQIENLKDRDLGTYGFLGYPLLAICGHRHVRRRPRSCRRRPGPSRRNDRAKLSRRFNHLTGCVTPTNVLNSAKINLSSALVGFCQPHLPVPVPNCGKEPVTSGN